MLLNDGIDGCDGKNASILVGTIAFVSTFRGCNVRSSRRGAGCQQHLSLPLLAYYPHLFHPPFIHHPIDVIVPQSLLLLYTWILAVLVVNTAFGGILLALLSNLVEGFRMSSVIVGIKQNCGRQ
jgi:hypothetical protein